MHKFDMKAVMDLDQVVSWTYQIIICKINWLVFDKQMSEQQVTLEKTGVPGFHVTNNPNEVRLQMYILEFILRLSEIKPD